ncbi:uncharacterized protein TRAVEDRAFT_72970 [Trametes versicolor FP-101664 SS1]|uniref:uncharacterized protein n=1 Tax=Trametes versicolor (strain FP-101664) TaxID=717944 RepID=UPI000462425E|nr:uncharacterized protein TRAVEDRAFT_72970 [Trametes versicolor FP-101664 SS1]EIW56349.1 hypothetical protein TRAVEDRAFT_72970 [Trametes versicolor FP-101664 SS1]
MNTLAPRLPIEVCENVIDHCISRVDAEHHEDVFESYGALLAFSLTCRNLLPRSRRNLYAVVMFTGSDQVDALCTTLTRPRRAGCSIPTG